MEREDWRFPGSWNDVFLDLDVQVAATSCQATAMVLGLLWLLWFVSRGPKLLEVEDTTFRSVKSRSVLPCIACFDIESGVISN